MSMPFKYKVNNIASLEALAPFKQPLPPFTQAQDLLNALSEKGKRELTDIAIDFTEYSCSKAVYGIYEKKGGGLLSKGKYEFAEDLSIDFSAFMALRQFYYMVHAALFDRVFNYLTIFIEAKGGKITKVTYSIGHDKGIDGAEGASHAAPSVKNAAKMAQRGTSVAMPAGAAALKF